MKKVIKLCRNCENVLITDNTYFCLVHNQAVRGNDSCDFFISGV